MFANLCDVCDDEEQLSFRIPVSVTVNVTVGDHTKLYSARQTPFVTCFRCGETGHFRAQCRQFRTKMCNRLKYGTCDDPECFYAHHPSQLRRPWISKCIRVIKNADRAIEIRGCLSVGHTFSSCPYQHQFALTQRSSSISNRNV